jgi:hypothetical protein
MAELGVTAEGLTACQHYDALLDGLVGARHRRIAA